MRRTKKVRKTVTEIVITCDFCGDERSVYGIIKKCKLCGRDTCWHCSIHLDFPCCNLLQPNFFGDYCDYVCKECWSKGENIREAIMKSRDKQEKKEDELLVEWKRLIN